MIEEAMQFREEQYVKKRSLNMNVLPEFKSMCVQAKEVSSRFAFISILKEKTDAFAR